MAYIGFVGSGSVGHFSSTIDLQAKFPAELSAGRMATVENGDGTVSQYFSDGSVWDIRVASTEIAAISEAVAGFVNFAAIGDSISSGYSDGAKTGWIAYAEQLAYPFFKPVRRSSDNWGFASPGFTTQQIIDAGYHTQAAQSSASVVMILAGANDFPTVATEDVTYNNILTLAAPSITAGKKIAVALLPRTHASSAENIAAMGRIAARLNRWAVLNGHTYVDLYSLSVDRGTGGMRSDITPDGVHPSEAWHWVMARAVVSAFGLRVAPASAVAGGVTGNPWLQTYSGGLASGWAVNNATPTEHVNTGAFAGSSQKISPTSDSYPFVYRTDGGVVSGKTYTVKAIFEVLSASATASLFVEAVLYKSGGGTQSIAFGSANSALAPLSGRETIPPGLYHVQFNFLAEDSGAMLINCGCQGGDVVVHYAGAI